MFNLVKDDFDENSDDILNSINKMLENTGKDKEEKNENIENNKKEKNS